jgi:TfoX/Sxy family transcriptional regulator of competence genes
VSYDDKLARRVRAVLKDEPRLEERPMFGGLAFLVDGKMCCGILNEDLVARIGPEKYEAALAQDHVRPMDFTGKPMKGYVYVGPEGYLDAKSLASWVRATVEFVTTLPRKTKPRTARKTPAKSKSKSKTGARR